MISVLLKALMSVLTRIFMAAATEKMVEWLLFKVADSIVKSTTTPHDDEFLKEIKEIYAKKNKIITKQN